MPKFDTPMEMVETLAEYYTKVFESDPDMERFKGLIDYFGYERVSEVLEKLFIRGAGKPKEGTKNNPLGYLYMICRNRWD